MTHAACTIHTAGSVMPIYEYRCRACNREFEAVILPKSDPTACPECQSTDLEKLLSSFGVSTDGTRSFNLKSGRKAAAKIRRDKEIAEHEAIHHHHH